MRKWHRTLTHARLWASPPYSVAAVALQYRQAPRQLSHRSRASLLHYSIPPNFSSFPAFKLRPSDYTSQLMLSSNDLRMSIIMLMSIHLVDRPRPRIYFSGVALQTGFFSKRWLLCTSLDVNFKEELSATGKCEETVPFLTFQ